MTNDGQLHYDALLESTKLLQASLDLDSLLNHLLRSAMGRLLARRGVVTLADESGVSRVAIARGISGLAAGDPFDEARASGAGIGVLLPIGSPEQPLGHLGLALAGELADEQREFLGAFLGIAASGIENARAHAATRHAKDDLERRVIQLRALLDLGRGFSSSVDPEQVAQLLGLTLGGQWALRRYAILAWKQNQPDVIREKSMKFSGSIDAIKEAASAIPVAALVASLEEGSLRELLSAEQAEAVVAIRSSDEIVGLVALGARPGGLRYAPDDLDFAEALVAQAAVALENAWHFRETLEKRKIEKELELAADIQRRLLPAALPKVAGIEAFAKSRPARHVGGDYYDVVPIDGAGETTPHLYCVADVSGKGIAASLLMSNFQASLRALTSPERSLPETARRMNELIHASTAVNKFVTAIFVAIDPVSGRVRYVNAGHNDGFVLRADGSVERLKACGLAVGLMPGRTYTEGETTLHDGDLVALYSDGVTEANDPDENEWGDDHFIECLRAHENESVEEMVGHLYEEIDRYAGTAPQYDDITLMIIRRGEPSPATAGLHQ